MDIELELQAMIALIKKKKERATEQREGTLTVAHHSTLSGKIIAYGDCLLQLEMLLIEIEYSNIKN